MEHDRHRFASLGLTAALSMLAAAPALASQGSALPCSGYWAGEMRGPHGRMLDRAEVEMQFIDCGRERKSTRLNSSQKCASRKPASGGKKKRIQQREKKLNKQQDG